MSGDVVALGMGRGSTLQFVRRWERPWVGSWGSSWISIWCRREKGNVRRTSFPALSESSERKCCFVVKPAARRADGSAFAVGLQRLPWWEGAGRERVRVLAYAGAVAAGGAAMLGPMNRQHTCELIALKAIRRRFRAAAMAGRQPAAGMRKASPR